MSSVSFYVLLLGVAVAFRPYKDTTSFYATRKWNDRFAPKNSMGKDKNSKAEVYLKVKRLKQVIESGKNYTAYLAEQNRYAARNLTLENRTQIMQDVVDYKEKLKKSLHKQIDAVFLPDISIEPDTWFYDKFLTTLNSTNHSLEVLGMPDVHAFNTKRYEFQWMQHMRTELRLQSRNLVVAHGSSADALLRYLETDSVSAAVIIDGSDIYTAGERHGRAYRYSEILKHCGDITLLATTEVAAAEMNTLREELRLPESRCLNLLEWERIQGSRLAVIDKLIGVVRASYDRQTPKEVPKSDL